MRYAKRTRAVFILCFRKNFIKASFDVYAVKLLSEDAVKIHPHRKAVFVILYYIKYIYKSQYRERKCIKKRAVSNAELKAFETARDILILVNAEKPAKS